MKNSIPPLLLRYSREDDAKVRKARMVTSDGNEDGKAAFLSRAGKLPKLDSNALSGYPVYSLCWTRFASCFPKVRITVQISGAYPVTSRVVLARKLRIRTDFFLRSFRWIESVRRTRSFELFLHFIDSINFNQSVRERQLTRMNFNAD